ncbi:MAG TPA: MFS transporter [Candidatus Obscuribacterales bacterium]
MSASPQEKHEPLAVLALPDFRRLLIARLFSTVALQIQSIAVGWQIYEVTKSPLSLGLIGLAEVLPAIAVALYAGHIADIVDRKRILASVLIVLCACIGGLSMLSFAHLIPALLCAMIYTLIAISGFARGFYMPSMFGLIAQIVPRNLYGNSSAWNSWVWQGSAIGGPVLGGFLYTKFGAGWTYFASTLLIFIGFLCITGVKSKSDLSTAPKGPILESIQEGLRFVFSNQVVLGAMALDLFAVLFGGAVALLPIFAAEVFHRGPEALGMLRAAPSIGAFTTASFLAFRPIKAKAGAIFMIAVAGFGFCMIGFGLSKYFYLSMLLLALSGLCDGISIYVRNTIYLLNTPDDMKGRFAAVNSIFIGSSNEIGEFESGVMAKLMGTIPSVIFGGCATLLVVLITAFRAPKLRKLDL